MIFTIYLYHQKIFQRDEIGNIHSNNMLPTEMDA